MLIELASIDLALKTNHDKSAKADPPGGTAEAVRITLWYQLVVVVNV